MKKTDIAMIVLIAGVSVLISYFVTNAILGEASSEPIEVYMVDEIKTSISKPDPAVFNGDAINPAVEVQIKPGSN